MTVLARTGPAKFRGQGPAIVGALVAAAIALLSFFAVLPIVWMVLSAFKSNAEILSPDRTFLPRTWTLSGFHELFQYTAMGRYLLNSLAVAGGIAVVQTVTASLAAYAFARIPFRGSGLLFAGLLRRRG